jgi:mannose-6-phosphate isomerase-like protein (cupin superfamily)
MEFTTMPTETIQTNEEKEKRNFSFEEAIKLLPMSEGKRFATVFERGQLLVEIYAPRSIDPQQPHTRDELYIVIQGSGFFFDGNNRVAFKSGDCLFAPAGITHRFEDFTDDFATWVIFYGPEGGS